MVDASASELRVLICRFIRGEDRLLVLAGELEVAIDRAFPEDEDWQELVLALASYRPGGGEYLRGEAEIAGLCAQLLPRLPGGC